MLCSGWTRFVHRHDPAGRFRLASVQSPTGQALLAWAGLPQDRFDTMAYIENGQVYTHSTAFLRIMRHFPWPWRILAVGQLTPALLRDPLYTLIARNRYRWFGRYEHCPLATPDLAARLL